ncbi:hypothetical protein [Methylobacterium sp. J-076]|uniref:hypothetical protein n=1 Tax=Methylobacterium sp. J-076 TaxID=2836655 RepID=UPI001FBB1D79|nr:hypothetical protein [Methylobacterium sp. J-076]MCJ2012827.1 hypothetical protein [Methylobacterium sp. J-076]
MALAMTTLAGPVAAADLSRSDFTRPDFADRSRDPALPPLPRYFPRGDGMEASGAAPLVQPRVRVRLACVPRRVPTPTNAPDDPSYVGSPYGLGRPSYYGFTPPPGIDDPYGRSVLPYCP